MALIGINDLWHIDPSSQKTHIVLACMTSTRKSVYNPNHRLIRSRYITQANQVMDLRDVVVC